MKMVMDVVVVPDDLFAKKEMTKSTTQLLRNAFNGNARVVHYSFAISRQVAILRFFVISASSVYITFRRKLIGPQYETNSDDVRHQFEEHGEIKTFFDLISTRGMVFVTYVSPARQILSHCVSPELLTPVLSTTYVLRKEHENDFRDQKSVVAL
jgi:hypothetical protein